MESMIPNPDDLGVTQPDSDGALRIDAPETASSSLAGFLDAALAQAAGLIDCDSPLVERLRAVYHRAFPLGEGLGDLLARRASLGQRQLGLAALIEDILQVPEEFSADPVGAARRALLAGLCWRIEASLLLSGTLRPELAGMSDGELYTRAVALSQSMAGDARAVPADDADGA